MANKEHLAILKKGVDAWNKWREENPGIVPDISQVYLFGKDVSRADFRQTCLSEADLHQADLSGAKLIGADLRQASLNGASLNGADISNADLRGADIGWANLSGARLNGANLSGANLNVATLLEASLSETNLIKANLSRANLYEANLSGANLTGCGLGGANLTGANLSEADLSETRLYDTVFARTSLKETKGLDRCRYLGQSIIDVYTLQRSGELPLSFLRGCGLSDRFIEYLPSLLSKPWEYYSCFISYSTKDQAFVDRLWADLQGNGIRCYQGGHDLRGGKKTYPQIDEAIRIHDRVILVLSENSIKSEWVMTEIRKALAKEKESGKDVLFPIGLTDYDKNIKKWECFDSDTGVDLAKKVREYHIPDFQSWKTHDAYKKGFDLLLRDLKQQNKIEKP